MAALAANFDLESRALVEPVALGMRAAKLGAGLESTRCLAFLVFCVGLPVERSLGAVTSLLGSSAEEIDCVGPAAFVDGLGAVRVEAAVFGLRCVVGDGCGLCYFDSEDNWSGGNENYSEKYGCDFHLDGDPFRADGAVLLLIRNSGTQNADFEEKTVDVHFFLKACELGWA